MLKKLKLKLKFSFSILVVFLFSINAYAGSFFAGNINIIGNAQIVNINPAFITEWTVSGDATARTITLPLYNSGTFNCTVKWGDGTADSTITSYNSANRIHTYATDGIYNVEIKGNCPAWSFNNTGDILKITKIISWGDISGFSGFKYLTGGFYGCTNLTSIGNGKIICFDNTLTNLKNCFNKCKISTIPAGIFDNCIYLASSGFSGTFNNCQNLVSIPADLFKYNTLVSSFGFENTFVNCYVLASIPADLFRYNTLVANGGFQYTFSSCYALTSIPTDLFRYNTAASIDMFKYTFSGCTNLTSVPTDLFRYNTLVSGSSFSYTFNGCSVLASIPVDFFRYNTLVSNAGFQSTFYRCLALTSIPTDLFRYNTAVSSNGFQYTFYWCPSLTSIPADLFRYNTLVSVDGFSYTFAYCTALANLPADLFRYNTLVSGIAFQSTFQSCPNLQLRSDIFYAAGEQGTRFLNKTISFQNCFSRTTFTGAQGTAPDLWNCNFGTGTPTKTTCFGGAGNSLTSISNYADIPADWK